MYSLFLKFFGRSDDIEVQIILETPTTRFRSDVGVSERDLVDYAFALLELSKFFYRKNDGSDIQVIFGPNLEGSPNCKITIKQDNSGKFLINLEMHQIVVGQKYTKTDKCITHFATDVAMLDEFVSGLKTVSERKDFTAVLEGYSISEL